MKLIFKKLNLINAVNNVIKAVPQKTTIPIQECILIDASSGKIILTGNDTEFGIETVCDGIIEESGIIALEARLFSEIIKKLPDFEENDVIIETDEKNVTVISCENAVFKISGRDGTEFAGLPEVDKTTGFSISQYSLKKMITQTIFSIGQNESNRKMTGEYFLIDGKNFYIYALDGHRIAERKIELSAEYEKIEAIVPGKALNELTKILTGGVYDNVNIFITNSIICFEFNENIVVTRLIDGEYFRVRQMMSDDYETRIKVNRRKLLEAIERALVFVRENEKNPLIFNSEGALLGLRIKTDMGTMEDGIITEKDGRDIKIGFNPKYLVEALRNIEDEEIEIFMSIPRSPGYIRNEEEGYNYMILPVNYISD